MRGLTFPKIAKLLGWSPFKLEIFLARHEREIEAPEMIGHARYYTGEAVAKIKALAESSKSKACGA